MISITKCSVGAVILAIIFSHQETYCQQEIFDDHLFPAKGAPQLTIGTGVPYLGFAEVAYGFSDRFAAGAIIGRTPNATGYGVRLRAILYQPNLNFRVYFRSPIFYYAKTKHFGDEPWILTWPVISTEWKLNSKGRFSVGAGFVEAHCIESLFKRKNQHGDGETQPEMEFQGGLWNTFHVGFAWPINKSLLVHTETSLVMKGLQLAGDDYIGGPPFIMVLGITKNF
jgi:hypothetical protein